MNTVLSFLLSIPSSKFQKFIKLSANKRQFRPEIRWKWVSNVFSLINFSNILMKTNFNRFSPIYYFRNDFTHYTTEFRFLLCVYYFTAFTQLYFFYPLGERNSIIQHICTDQWCTVRKHCKWNTIYPTGEHLWTANTIIATYWGEIEEEILHIDVQGSRNFRKRHYQKYI